MIILAIDPGSELSAWVTIDHAGRPTSHAKQANAVVLSHLRGTVRDKVMVAIEMIASYGMPVGAEVFQTCLWVGRFIEAWEYGRGAPVHLVYRRDVKMHLCGNARAKDANVRRAILDRFGGDKAKGTKRAPGPLYGIKADEWQALAVALTFLDTRSKEAKNA